jgi:aminopeptidase N
MAAACAPTASKMPQKKDVHTFAQPEQARVHHLDLFLNVDLDAHQLLGRAAWKITAEADADTLILDTDRLSIGEVVVNGKPASFTLGTTDPILGTPLHIALPKHRAEDTLLVEVGYGTHPDAGALQWLSAEQTNGKTHPFLFTQSQAILARSWIPCQDGPGIRFTYNANVEVPPHLMAVMSAENPQKKSADGTYSFRMPQAIPSYLMALAVGDLAFAPLSERTGVYAEPAFLQACANEFVDVEKMVQAAESLYGPYAWGRYDLLVLPASFPFGGMENPRLTFATPTIVAGDRSLVSLVAHELAHSWSGNLVTNATWNDFWLNEGFTVYFENRIMEAVYGKDYADMLAALSHRELLETVAEFQKSAPNDTKLAIDLAGRNPDDGVTAIAYEKGFHFLLLIEKTVGRPRWDAFLNGYFAQNGFGTMTTEQFEKLITTELLTDDEAQKIGLDEWIHGTGLPANCPEPVSARFAQVDALAAPFSSSGAIAPALKTAWNGWSTHERLRFLQSVEGATADQLRVLDQAFGLTATGNAELAAQWFQTAARAELRSPELAAATRSFLVRVGRRKFLTPTYEALLNHGQADLARSIYQEARPGYHAVARGTLDALLKP